MPQKKSQPKSLEQQKREKLLESAILKAKAEFTPYWFYSKPLFAGVLQQNHYKLFILDPIFTKNTWLIFFLDFISFHGVEICDVLDEWVQRYKNNTFNILFIVQDYYTFLNELIPNGFLIAKRKFHPIVVIDKNDVLRKTFEIKRMPTFLLMNDNHKEIEINFLNPGAPWYHEAERALQAFLRKNDIGLATPPVFNPMKKQPVDDHKIEFGQLHQESSTYTIVKIDAFVEKLEPNHVYLHGKWTQENERITTQDPTAYMQFIASSTHLSIIAQSHTRTLDKCYILVEIDGRRPYEEYFGEHASVDDSAQCIVKITKPQIYHVATHLPSSSYIFFKFINVQLAPISLFSIRFGNILSSTDH
jgi:hypothetical protein